MERRVSILSSWIRVGPWLLWPIHYNESDMVTSMLDQEASSLFAETLLLDPWATTGYPEVTMLWGRPSMWETTCGPIVPRWIQLGSSRPGSSRCERRASRWFQPPNVTPSHLCLPSWDPRHHRGDTNYSHCTFLYSWPANPWTPQNGCFTLCFDMGHYTAIENQKYESRGRRILDKRWDEC